MDLQGILYLVGLIVLKKIECLEKWHKSGHILVKLGLLVRNVCRLRATCVIDEAGYLGRLLMQQCGKWNYQDRAEVK